MAESKALLEDKDELDVLSFGAEVSTTSVPLTAQLKVQGKWMREGAEARRRDERG